MKKILWFSSHPIHKSQEVELKRLFGKDVKVDKVGTTFGDAKVIAENFFRKEYDWMVVVAPLSVIAIFCEKKVPMLWAQSVEENDHTKIDYYGARKQGYRFSHFKIIKQVKVEFAEIGEEMLN